MIQFPIADGRSFVERRDLGDAQAENGRVRLGRPDFSNLKWDPPPDYLRYFGRAIERKRGKQSAWFDEQAYCRADRAIRFVDLQRHPLAADSIALPAACAFRRVFGDGGAVSRMEVGVRAPSAGSVTGLTGAQCRDLVADFMLLPTRVRALGAEPSKTPVYQAPAPLVRQGIHLAKLYGRATAAKLTDEELSAQSRLVKHGLPLVIVEFEMGEADRLPEDAHVVDPAAVGGADLAFSYVQYSKDDRTPTWFLRPGTTDAEQLRNLRLVLLRLHAQRQALNLVLTQVLDSVITFRPETDAGTRLNDYLNAAMTIVQKPGSHGGVSQPGLWKAIDDAETAEAALGAASHTIELVQGSIDRDRLLARLTSAQGQLQRRVGAYASGVRPGIPVDVSPRLVDLLIQLALTADFLGRGRLLDSIPSQAALHRSENNRRLDLDLIVDQVIAIGALTSGVQPLVVLIDNALRHAAEGSAVHGELQSIRAARVSAQP